ncbi:hypothetical protein [Paenibacillus sp. 2TAB26]
MSMLRDQLDLFDTQILDVTDYMRDSVQALLSVQLGGGTTI